MSSHKSQHFVPRTYLKNFSNCENLRSINILTVKNRKLIKNASIRDQCSKNFFYGKDLILEKILQNIEGVYSTTCCSLIKDGNLTESEIHSLKNFSLLQFLRTDIAIRRQMTAMTEMENLVFENAPEQKPKQKYDAVGSALEAFYYGVKYIYDLKSIVVKNNTNIPFITSDDPCIDINKFYYQKVGKHFSWGMSNSGYCLFLPISSKFGIFSYDDNIYNVDSKNRAIYINNKDVDTLNGYVVQKSNNCIYFGEWDDRIYVQDIVEVQASNRPKSWFNIHFAVAIDRGDDNNDAFGQRFEVVNTREERQKSQNSLIHIEKLSIKPHRWPTFLKYRVRPKFIDTESAAGLIRPDIPPVEAAVSMMRSTIF